MKDKRAGAKTMQGEGARGMKHFYDAIVGKVWAEKKLRRIAAAIFVPLCVAAVVLTVALSMQKGLAAGGDLWDLATFQDSFKIMSSTFTELPLDGDFAYNTTYNFEVHFEAPTQKYGPIQKPYYKDDWLTYSLPNGVQILFGDTGRITLGNTLIEIGDYKIDVDGDNLTNNSYIWVHFDDVKVDSAYIVTPTPGTNLLDQDYSALNFEIKFQAKFVKIGGNNEFIFGDDTDIVVIPQEETEKLKVEKGFFTDFNTDTRTRGFVITLTAEEGSITVTRLFDRPGKPVAGDEHKYEVKTLEALYERHDLSDFVKALDVKLDGTLIPSSEYSLAWSSDHKGFEIIFNSPQTIPEGKSLTVGYMFYYDEIIQLLYPDTAKPNYDIPFRNRVDVFNGNDPKGWAIFNERLYTAFYTKTGSYNKGDNTITWTGGFGDGFVPLNGWTITDTLGAGMTGTGATLAVKLKGKNKNEIWTTASPGTTSITPTLDASGFTFTIPSGGINGTDVYWMEFTYTVPVTSGSNQNETLQNNIGFHNDASTISGSGGGSAEVERVDAEATKTGELFLDDPVYGNYIQWTVRFTIPGALENKAVIFFDYLSTRDSDGIMLRASYDDFLIAYEGPEGFTPITDPKSPNRNMTLMLRPNMNGIYVNRQKNGWWLFFSASTGAARPYDPEHNSWNDNTIQASLSPFHENAVIVVTYKMSLDEELYATSDNDPRPLGMTGLEYLKSTPATGSNMPYIHNWGRMEYLGGVKNGTVDIYYPLHKSAVVVGDRVDYTVRVRTPELNEGWAAQSTWLEDEFNGKWLEYVPNSFRVTFNENGIHGPYAKGTPITDLLETGADTAIAEISTAGEISTMRVNFWKLPQVGGPSGSSFYGAGVRNFTGNPPTTFSGSPPTKAEDPRYVNSFWVIRYSLQLKEGEGMLDEFPVTNKIRMGDYDNECTTTVGRKAVTKTMTATGGGTAAAEFILNPLGRTLDWPPWALPGSHIYTAVDEMSTNLAYIAGSLQFWKRANLDAPWTPVLPVAQAADASGGEAWTYWIVSPHEIHFWFPDETPVRVTYRVRGLASETAEYWNKVTAGVYLGEDWLEGFDVNTSSGKADLVVNDLLVSKIDSVTGEPIEDGVDFALYIGRSYTQNFTANMALADAHGYPRDFIIAGIEFYYVQDGTTENGFLSFSKELYAQFPNLIYALYEKEAPPGYLGPAATDPVEDHVSFFYFQFPSLATVAPFTALGYELYDSWGTVEVENTRAPSTEVTLKALKNTSGAPMEAKDFAFELYGFEDGHLAGILQTARNLEGGMSSPVAFDPLSFSEPDEYFYFLKETDSLAGWAMDPTRYLIHIVVGEDMTATVTYIEADEDGNALEDEAIEGLGWIPYDGGASASWPTFNNVYGGPVFPEVGGIGIALFVIGGGILSVFLAGAFTCYRRRRRRLTLLE